MTIRKKIRIKNHTLIIACICLIALSNFRCGRGNERTPSNKSTITVLYPSDERVLGPYWEMPAKFLMFLPLVTEDSLGRPWVGRLAERWEHSPDFRLWTFHLRRDVRWHDGVPVTAHDIRFSLELFANPDILFDNVWHEMESFTILDDFTFKMTFKKPVDALDSWRVYYPKHLLEKLDPKEFWKWEFWTQPLGNGPYRYVRHVPKIMVELEANADFYGGKPKIDRVVLKLGGSAPLVELMSGNVDALTSINRADLPKLGQDPRFRVYHHTPTIWLIALLWNHRHHIIRDSAVRRALTLAINRRELHQVLNLPENLLIFDVIFTTPQYWRGELPEPLPYDPEMAKRLLEQEGWRDIDGDGVRELDGEELRFTALVPGGATSWAPGTQQAAIYIQEQFRRVGIRMELQELESSLVRERLHSGDFEAGFFRFFNGVDSHIKWLGEDSWIGYENSQVARLLDIAEITMDPAEGDRIYRELMPMFRADLPITFLYPQVWTVVAHRRLKGLINQFRVDPVTCMEYLWLEEEE